MFGLSECKYVNLLKAKNTISKKHLCALCYKLVHGLPAKMKIFSILAKNTWKMGIEPFP